jgi:hypothetical protein
MEEIEELILFENENTRLDFKKIEYIKENYSSFLKDIISMANANTNEDRYILIGLKPKSEIDRGFKGIEGEITDSASLQQLVYENIEPELNLEYFPYQYKEYQIGIIRITNCNNQPYLMKKDYGNGKNKLFRGEGFIRKGSHQTRLVRKDYERFTNQKIDEKYFKGEILFSFKTINSGNEIILKSINDLKIPSQIIKEKIKKIIKEKTEKEEKLERFGMSNLNRFEGINLNASLFGGGTTYEQRDIPTLKKNLENVEDTYSEDDNYEIFEKNSNKCNISILNKGKNYIEDASIVVKIPKLEGIFISEQVYQEPNQDKFSKLRSNFQIGYPLIEITEDFFIIKNSIGNIKHQIKQDAFDIDFRLFATTKLEEKELKINCELFGKNLKNSIKEELLIKIKK